MGQRSLPEWRTSYETHLHHIVAQKGVHEIGQKSSNILRTKGVGLKTACTPMDLSNLRAFQSKTRNPSNIKKPTSPFSIEQRSWHMGQISGEVWINCPLAQNLAHIRHRTYIAQFDNQLPNPTSYPTHLFAESFQNTWDANNYRDQIREGKRKERERRAANSINSWSSPA